MGVVARGCVDEQRANLRAALPLGERPPMSAFCQKQTSTHVPVMSALPPKADIGTGTRITFDAATPAASSRWPRCVAPHLSSVAWPLSAAPARPSRRRRVLTSRSRATKHASCSLTDYAGALTSHLSRVFALALRCDDRSMSYSRPGLDIGHLLDTGLPSSAK